MKFIFHIVKKVVFVSMLFTFMGCGDEGADDFPFFIDAHNSTIDLRGTGGTDGQSLIATTIFDDQGAPVTSGTMYFTLSQNARGSFAPLDAPGALPVKTFGVDIDDGVAEAIYYSTLAPETVVVKAYVARFPGDASVSTSITVLNDTLQADFTYSNLGDQIVEFYDMSGYTDANTIPTFAWDFSADAGAVPQNSTERDPICTFSVAGTYQITLTINGTSVKTFPVVVQ